MPSDSEDKPRETRPVAPERPAPPPSQVASRPETRALEVTEEPLLTEESFRAILSAQQRGGRWEPADEIQVRSICGDVTLDFRHAELPASGIVGIDAWAICGNISIIVPDGSEVELNGTPVLGSIERRARARSDAESAADLPQAPPAYFRIDGRAIMGAIEVAGA